LKSIPVSRPMISSGIHSHVDNRHHHSGLREPDRRNVRIDDPVEVVQQEAALIGINPSSKLKPVFRPRKRAWPRPGFDPYAPKQRGDVQPAEQWMASGDSGSEDHPKNEEGVDSHHRAGDYIVELHLRPSRVNGLRPT
jgi:hypothetical protein